MKDRENPKADNPVDCMKCWIKKLEWEETDLRTDARLKVTISPFLSAYGDTNIEATNTFLTVSKRNCISLVEELCTERVDTYKIDAIGITLDGDTEDTTITITANIHLAE